MIQWLELKGVIILMWKLLISPNKENVDITVINTHSYNLMNNVFSEKNRRLRGLLWKFAGRYVNDWKRYTDWFTKDIKWNEEASYI